MATFQENLPQTSDDVVQPMLTDTQRELDKVPNENRANVFLDASWLRAIIVSCGNRIFDVFGQLFEAINLNMPDTATGEFVDRHGVIYVGARGVAVGSTGNIAATGTAASIITLGSNYQSTDGIAYVVTLASTITAQVLSVSSITLVGTIATVTTAVDHNLGSNVPVTIAGAVEIDYNVVDAEIQVTGVNTFTYTVENSPTSPATGTITATFTAASVPIDAVVPSDPDAPFGAVTNQILDTPLTLQITIAGVDSIANVDFNQLAGGADIESDADYKTRYLDKIQNPVSHFASSDIEQTILQNVPGVTRVFIQPSGFVLGTFSVSSITLSGVLATVVTAAPHNLFTGYEVTIAGAVEPEYNVTAAPILLIDDTTFAYIVTGAPSSPATGTITSSGAIGLGRVQIFFVRDDDDPIPSVSEVADVKAAVLVITPANTPDVFVRVDPPVALPVDFTFTNIFPDTTTMRSAVIAQLQQFFDEGVSVGVNIDEDVYRAVIITTVDTDSGDRLETFTISAPSGDIVVDVDELPTLGTVTFS